MKLKHNKLRNPSILFELLVRQITTDTLSNKESVAVDILKKYYNNSHIAKEYKLYKLISEAKNLSEAKADVLLNVVLESYKKLNKGSLKKQKYDLIAEIKQHYNIEEFFKAKVENYKNLASIYMLFEISQQEDPDPSVETKYRFSIIESISKPVSKNTEDPVLEQYRSFDKGTKHMVYKMLIQKFNEKYYDLDSNQKSLLKEYITNISTSNKLREYVNSEYDKVKKELKKHSTKIFEDARKVKIDEILTFIEPIPDNKQVCERDINNLLYYYELLKEVKEVKGV